MSLLVCASTKHHQLSVALYSSRLCQLVVGDFFCIFSVLLMKLVSTPRSQPVRILSTMYQAISRICVSRTKLARTCLSVTSLLVQVVGVPRSLFFWCPECCAQFLSLVDLRNPGVRTRPMRDLRLSRASCMTVVWWRAALRSSHRSNFPQSAQGATVFATWVISV